MPNEDPVTGTATEEEIPQETAPETPPDVQEEVVNDDPGQQEGTGNQEPKNEGPPEGSPRWNEIYYKQKEGERQVASLTEKLEEITKKYEEATVKTQPQQPVTQPVEPPPPPPKDEELLALSEEIGKLRSEKAQAIKDYEGEKAADIENKIDGIRDQILAIKLAEKQVINPGDIDKLMKEKEINIAVNNFAAKNTWLDPFLADGVTPNPNYDDMKAGAAIALERRMRTTYRGTYSEMLEEIGKQVSERFDTPTTAPPAKLSAVASVANTSKTVTNNKVTTLNADQKKAAKAMFFDKPDPEQAYIAAMQGGAK